MEGRFGILFRDIAPTAANGPSAEADLSYLPASSAEKTLAQCEISFFSPPVTDDDPDK
jgi:hypothetical protein